VFNIRHIEERGVYCNAAMCPPLSSLCESPYHSRNQYGRRGKIGSKPMSPPGQLSGNPMTGIPPGHPLVHTLTAPPYLYDSPRSPPGQLSGKPMSPRGSYREIR
jgi:hypothetical protein